MVTLGIDPGYARLGWCALDHKGRSLEKISYGIIETDKAIVLSQRLAIISQKITEVFMTYKPTIMAIEELYFSKNVKTALLVSQARGVILATAALHDVKTISYSPMYVKQTITGSGKADKKQIQIMIRSLLRLDKIPQPDDVADAIALALTHALSYTMNTKYI